MGLWLSLSTVGYFDRESQWLSKVGILFRCILVEHGKWSSGKHCRSFCEVSVARGSGLIPYCTLLGKKSA